MDNEKKELTTIGRDIVISADWQNHFDKTIRNCSKALITGSNTIKDSIAVMNGIKTLKEFFKLPEVKELIELSKDNRAGFLTDRSPAAIQKHNMNPNKTYELKPYTYDQVINGLLPCILEGYRPHGNEINIIAGNGMPVKAGKYRRIIEMTDGFQENISTPAVKDSYAFMKCRAKWKLNGKVQTIGVEEGDEIHIKIKFGKWDSLDKVIGLAQSKLYTRVLTRITGRFMTDEPESINITEEAYEIKSPKNTFHPPSSEPDDELVPESVSEPEPVSEPELIPEIIQLQEMFESEEYRPVIQKLIEDMSLPLAFGKHIEKLEKDGNIEETRRIIQLIESGK